MDRSNVFDKLALCVGPAPAADHNYAAVLSPDEWTNYALLMPLLLLMLASLLELCSLVTAPGDRFKRTS